MVTMTSQLWAYHGTYISQQMFLSENNAILDDDVAIMCPSDLIVCDSIGTKGVRLGQLVLGEPVSD